MSHTSVYQTACTDPALVEITCQQVEARFLGYGEHSLYSSRETGLGVHLRNWDYPVVFDKQGVAKLDNYKERWGRMDELQKFTQRYAVNVVKQQYKNKPVTEKLLSNGEIELTVDLGETQQLQVAETSR